AEQAGRQARDLACESELRSRADAYRQSGIIRRRKTTRSGAEISRHESVSHFCGPRSHALEAKVTHWRLLSSQVLHYSTPTAVPIPHSKQVWCRGLTRNDISAHARPARTISENFPALGARCGGLLPRLPARNLVSVPPALRRNFWRRLLPLGAIVAQ